MMRISFRSKIVISILKNIVLEFKLITFLMHNASFIVWPMKPLAMNCVVEFDDK